MDRIQSLILEGGDGVGKNFLAVEIVRCLLANEEQIIFTNFPQYWFFGYDIRFMNRAPQAKKEMARMNGFREAEVRAAMYALDRAFGLSFILRLYDKYPNAIHISDRGPFSNAVTAGFMWSQGKLTDFTIDEFIEEVIPELDQEMLSYLSPTSILCRNPNLEGKNGIHRERLDDLEELKPQEYAARAYAKLHLPTVMTAGSEGWRPATEIIPETLNQTNMNVDPEVDSSHIDLIQAAQDEQLLLVGPHTIPVPTRNGNPILSSSAYNKWLSLSLLSNQQLTALGISYSDDRKVELDYLEPGFSNALKWAVANGSTIIDLHPVAKQAIRRILLTYPEILEIVLPATNPGGSGVPEFIGYMRNLATLES